MGEVGWRAREFEVRQRKSTPVTSSCQSGVAPPSASATATAGHGALGLRSSDCALLFAAALASRSWGLCSPREVVFDEVHFGKFARAYFTGEHYFDIHPPAGKLVLALGAWLGAGFGEARSRALAAFAAQPFAVIGEPIGADVPLLGLRGVAVLASSALVPLSAALASRLGCSRQSSILIGWLLLTETSLLTDGRLLLMDAQLCAYCAAQLYCALRARHAVRWSLPWFRWLVLSGLSIGMAVGTKWTALSVMATVAGDSVAALWEAFELARPTARELRLRERERGASGAACALRRELLPVLAEACVRLVLLAGVAFAVYCLSFAVHFRLLHAPGEGDAFMSARFTAALRRAPIAAPLPPHGRLWRLIFRSRRARANGNGGAGADQAPMGFWAMLLELNRRMLSANASITRGHSWGSPWYEWPLGFRPILYWTRDVSETASDMVSGAPRPFHWLGYGAEAEGAHAMMYFFANPAVWWPVTFGAVLFALGTAGGVRWGEALSAFGSDNQHGCAGAVAAMAADWATRLSAALGEVESGLAHKRRPSSPEKPTPRWPARQAPPARLLLCGWALCWLPFAAVSRVQFLYHYYPSLILTLPMAALALDRAMRSRGARARTLACGALALASAAGCAFWAPLALGLPLTDAAFDRRFWFEAWR